MGIFIWNKIADTFGRKINGYLLCCTQIIGWIGIIFASSSTHLIIARFIIGLGGCGIISNSQLYVSETTDDDIKGPLCSLILVCMNGGIVLVFIMGTYLSYETLNIVCLCFSLVFLVLYYWLPETPLFLTMNDRLSEAKQSMNWFGLEKMTTGHHGEENTSQASYTELFSTREMARITFVGMFLLIGQQMSGIGAILAYSESIFQLTGTTVPTHVSTIFVGLIQLFVSAISGVVVKSNPRKPLLLFSYVGAFLSYVLIVAYFYLQGYNDSFILKCLPTAGVLCFIVMYNLGIGPLPFVIFPEMFPARVLNHGISLSLVVLVITAFTITKVFPVLSAIFGQCGIFLLFSCFNLFFALFVLKFVRETKESSDKVKNAAVN